jgi:general secretion pathway protein D
VNTQFQYLDVGVNIDITPYVHGNNEVTLKMSLEISSVTGVQNIGGFNQPTIGQRRVEHEARLADGEVNLIGGILEDTDTNSMSGYPLLMKIPILKYFFGQETKERRTTEIVFAITPHIIRSGEVTDENLKMVDLGTANGVTYRRDENKADVVKPLPAQSTPQPTEKPAPGPPTAKTQPQAAPKPSMQPIADNDELRVMPALPEQLFSHKPSGTVKPAFGNANVPVQVTISWPPSHKTAPPG